MIGSTMRFALISGGVVVNVADMSEDFARSLTGFDAVVEADADAVPGWVYKGGKLSPPPTDEPSAPDPTYRLKLTPSEFRNAFSAFEEVKIVEFAAGESEGDNAERRTLRKVVGVFFDRLKDQHLTTVDLADARNLAGLDILVSVGILTPDRRAAIAQGLPA